MKSNELLVTRLIDFYKLEEFQVAYYNAQLSSSQGKYYSTAFSKMVEIESMHAEFFAQQLNELGIEVPKVTGSLFTLAGSILGDSVELTGFLNTCKLGITLENHAINAYQKFIIETESYPDLNKILWEFLIDEEFHTLWMEDYMKRHIKKNE